MSACSAVRRSLRFQLIQQRLNYISGFLALITNAHVTTGIETALCFKAKFYRSPSISEGSNPEMFSRMPIVLSARSHNARLSMLLIGRTPSLPYRH
jgi:hypothetical protein